MATRLEKTVKRQMMSLAEERGKNNGKPLIIELRPGDMLSFRAKGTRQEYTVYLGHCFRLAQIMTVDTIYKEAVKAYNIKKGMGQKRMRKPKRASLPYGAIYFQALTK